jgi:hypothetical protein
MRRLLATPIAALLVVVPAAGATPTALTTPKAKRAITSAAKRSGYETVHFMKCRRKSERKVQCSVKVTAGNGVQQTISYLAYRNSHGKLAVKRVASTGAGDQNGPGAPIT